METIENIYLNSGRGPIKTKIINARTNAEVLNLEMNGFELVNHTSSLKTHDFYVKETVESIYYTELMERIKTITGCSEAFCFMHCIRNSSRINNNSEVLDYVAKIHIDYSIDQGKELVKDILKMNKHTWNSEYKYQILNVWRNISSDSITQNPLTVVDTNTLHSNDIIPIQLAIKAEANLDWYYYPHMNNEEILVFKQYDSSQSDLSKLCFHSSFELPYMTSTGSPRESVEARLVVVYMN